MLKRYSHSSQVWLVMSSENNNAN